MKRNLLPSMTMVELLIVVGIIVILSAATIPSYVGFADRRDFINKTDILLNEVRLVRNKSLAGVTQAGSNVSWGISPDCTNLTEYSLGYSSGSPDQFQIQRTVEVPGSFRFNADNCDTILFERLTGLPVLESDENSKTIRVDHIRGGEPVGYADIFVNQSGQIGLTAYQNYSD